MESTGRRQARPNTQVIHSTAGLLASATSEMRATGVTGGSGGRKDGAQRSGSMTLASRSPAAAAAAAQHSVSGNINSEMSNMRWKAVQEFIETELSYNADLKNVIEVYIEPLKHNGILSVADIEDIFVNWKELLACSDRLMKAFTTRQKTMQQINIDIGDILLANISRMQVYIRFCSCHFNSSRLLQEKLDSNPRLREFCSRAQDSARMKGLPITSYTVKPMQRVTKYPLLIDKIIKYTPVTCADRTNLEKALIAANQLCSLVNEGVREQENTDKLEWLQRHVCFTDRKIPFNSATSYQGMRKYLYSGTLLKGKAGKELMGLLFTDFLLLTRPDPPAAPGGGVASVFSNDVPPNIVLNLYRQPMMLNEVRARRGDDADSTSLHIDYDGKCLTLKAVNTIERNAWVTAIDSASQEYIAQVKRHMKQSIRANYERKGTHLIITVMEGCNLIVADITGFSDPYCVVTLGLQHFKTKVIKDTLNPQWNEVTVMDVLDIQQDVVCFTVYDKDKFSTDDFLGSAEIRVRDILRESQLLEGAVVKRFKLQHVHHGEIIVKFQLQINV